MSLINSATSAFATFSNFTLRTGMGQVQGSNQAQGSDASAVTVSDTDQAKVSRLGQLMGKLGQLSNTDQDAFKATAQTISDNLAQSAKSSTDPKQKEAFSNMSAKFAEAAKTGDISSLGDLTLGIPAGGSSASGGTTGGDTVTISPEGKNLASKGDTSGDEGSSESTTSKAANASKPSGASGKAGAGKAAGTGGSSSSGGQTASEIDKEINDVKQKIQKVQSQLQQSQQLAQNDDSKADEVKSMTVQLSSLNAQLSELQNQKLLAQNGSGSSTGSGGASGGGASMTTHA